MKIYGQCPYCDSMETRSVKTGVDIGNVPPTAWDARHCDECGHDYVDYWSCDGDDCCDEWE